MIRITEAILEHLRQGGTMVVPSRVHARTVKLAYAAHEIARGRNVWRTPDALPVEAWITRQFERDAATSDRAVPRGLWPAEEWLLWRQCTAEAADRYEVLNRGDLAEALRNAAALAAEFEIDLAADPGELNPESRLLWQVERAVRDKCRKLGARSTHSLADNLNPAGQPLAFAGFPTPPPRLRRLGALPLGSNRELTRPRAVIARDETDELERIADWVQEKVLAIPTARLLVMLPGPPGSRERLAALIRQAVDPRSWLEGDGDARHLVGFTGGTPLNTVPAVAHALTMLAWLGGASMEIELVSEWLRSPFWHAPAAGARARIELWLRHEGRLEIDSESWKEAVRNAPAPIVSAAETLTSQLDRASDSISVTEASPREWSARFRDALAALSWGGDPERPESERQAVIRFHELLDDFGQLAASTGSMSRTDALTALTELARRTHISEPEVDSVVTIAAALADPIVIYDGVWVAGLHADAFPLPVRPDPFVPLAAQLERSIPSASAQGRLHEARALLEAWRASAAELTLSSPARRQDLDLLPSPLLARWLATDLSGKAGKAAIWLPTRIHRSNLLEIIEDPGLPWPPGWPLPGGTRSLELQNLCPFRAYAELRLGSAEMEESYPGVAADVRGKLLHAALHHFWDRVRDSHALASLSPAQLDGSIEQCVIDAAQELWPGGLARPLDELPPVRRRECRRAVRLIKELCALERQRGPFSVVDTEFETMLTVSGAQLAMRVDRLDRLEGGGHAVLDYKSGRYAAADWYSERPSHPQLLAYVAALKDVVAMAMINVNAREVRFNGVADAAARLPGVKAVKTVPQAADREAWRLRKAEWLACVERLTTEFLTGRAAVEPKPGACEFCHLVSVCRISERTQDTLSLIADPFFEANDD